MRQLFAVTSVILFLVLAGASAAPRAEAVDLEAERASLMKADRAAYDDYSTSDSPLEAIFAHFTDDPRVLPPGAPLARDLEESRSVFEKLEALPGYSLTWNPATADVSRSGDLGYTIGIYHMEFRDAAGKLIFIDGKYLSVWKKQPDGTWKIAVDMFNDNGPTTPVEK